jgi:hypothetical protein
MVCFYSCTTVETIQTKNSFYITYHTNDTLLKNNLILVSRNKVSYYDSGAKLFRIIPINYKTNDFDDMHYFFTDDQIANNVKEGMVMYDIQISDNPRYDSTAFRVKKFFYQNKEWKPKSDMGWINVYFPDYSRAIEERKRKKLSEYIIQTIAKDSYTIQ